MDKTFEVLSALFHAEGAVSGEALGKQLGMSRAGILRHIDKLKEAGYPVSSVSGRGHELCGELPYRAESVRLLLRHDLPVALFESVGSTNDLAKQSDAAQGVVIAKEQTSGRGRKRREFRSGRGGVYLSYSFSPRQAFRPMAPAEAVRAVLLAAIAEVRMLRAFGADAMVKWPNDVLVGGKKICGILSEMIADPEEISRIVAGIGTNVENDPGLPHATSLRQVLGDKTPPPVRVAAELSDCLSEVFSEYFERGFEPLRREYLARSLTVGSRVRVETESERFEALAVDVNADGFLLVDRGNGRELVLAGDVTVRSPEGEYL